MKSRPLFLAWWTSWLLFTSARAVNPGCECVLFSSTWGKTHGVFTSPDYPKPYDPGIGCLLYTFIGKPDEIVEITLAAIDLPSVPQCDDVDSIRLYLHLEKPEVNEKSLWSASLCGNGTSSGIGSASTGTGSKPKYYSAFSNLVLAFLTRKRTWRDRNPSAVGEQPVLPAAAPPDITYGNNRRTETANGSLFHRLHLGFTGVYRFIPRSQFRSDGHRVPGTSCDSQFISSSQGLLKGKFYSPLHPSVYPPRSRCLYRFYGRYQEHVKIVFDKVNLNEDDVSCLSSQDSIKVYDGSDITAPVIAHLCGVMSYVELWSSGRTLLIEFVSNSTGKTGPGFEARFHFYPTYTVYEIVGDDEEDYDDQDEADSADEMTSTAGPVISTISPTASARTPTTVGTPATKKPVTSASPLMNRDSTLPPRKPGPTLIPMSSTSEKPKQPSSTSSRILLTSPFSVPIISDSGKTMTYAPRTVFTMYPRTTAASPVSPLVLERPVAVGGRLSFPTDERQDSSGHNPSNQNSASPTFPPSHRDMTAVSGPGYQQQPSQASLPALQTPSTPTTPGISVSTWSSSKDGPLGSEEALITSKESVHSSELLTSWPPEVADAQSVSTAPENASSACDHMFRSDVSKNGTFASSGYPATYPPLLNCHYEFRGHGKERVQIVFSDFQLHHPHDDPQESPLKSWQQYSCEGADKLEAFITIRGQKEKIDDFCGSSTPRELMSNSATMSLQFTSLVNSRGGRGFKARYAFVENFGITVGEQLTTYPCVFKFNSSVASNGSFWSPNYPGYYPRETECHYFFYGQPGERVRLQFTYFDIEGMAPCSMDSKSDYLEFSNFMTVDRKMPRYCGNAKPDPHVDSDAGFFRVTFKSNDRYDATGFSANYQFIPIVDAVTITKRRQSVSGLAWTIGVSPLLVVLTVISSVVGASGMFWRNT